MHNQPPELSTVRIGHGDGAFYGFHDGRTIRRTGRTATPARGTGEGTATRTAAAVPTVRDPGRERSSPEFVGPGLTEVAKDTRGACPIVQG
ncbi:hypothetical protein GCM10027091_41110 [Streptomyces daliensis]